MTRSNARRVMADAFNGLKNLHHGNVRKLVALEMRLGPAVLSDASARFFACSAPRFLLSRAPGRVAVVRRSVQ